MKQHCSVRPPTNSTHHNNNNNNIRNHNNKRQTLSGSSSSSSSLSKRSASLTQYNHLSLTSPHTNQTSKITNRSAHTNHNFSGKSTCERHFKNHDDSRRINKRYYATQPIQRSPAYSKLTEEDVAEFNKIVSDFSENNVAGTQNLIYKDKSELQAYNEDWMGKYHGHSQLVLFPRNTTMISKILQYCNQRKLAVCTQGGNTGLVGGSVPVFDEIIISMAKMNKITAFDKISGVVTCQSGVILANLEEFLEKEDYTVPLDLGAKGSCFIGGNLATNAGGIRLLRYGSLRANVLGLEVVLPNGDIIDNLRQIRKDNTGYDLKQLFIGSEGTLGVISAVSLLVPRKPKAVNVAFFGCPTFDHVLRLLSAAKSNLAEILSAFEFLDRASLELVVTHIEGSTDPLAEKAPFYVVIETSGSDSDHDRSKFDKFLEYVTSSEIVSDGTLAEDIGQAQSLWKLRESISECLKKDGFVYKYDVSIPAAVNYDLVDQMRSRIGHKGNVFGYGHLGDGNLHLNVTTSKKSAEVEGILEPFVYEYVKDHNGSISAEHGIGLMKASQVGYSKSQETIEVTKALKTVFDPNKIMNPYKLFPPNFFNADTTEKNAPKDTKSNTADVKRVVVTPKE